MANKVALKRRITSVRNTRQMTKAMELVSASKMRRAQEHAARSRVFRNLARQLLTRLGEVTDVAQHPLYATRTISSRLHVFLTSDRGLAGAFNSNLLRFFTAELMRDQADDVKSAVVLVGKQGHRLVSRLEGVEIVEAFDNFPENPTANDIRPILTIILDSWRAETADAVDITYTDYKTSLRQEVRLDRLLPAARQSAAARDGRQEVIFEPDPLTVLNGVTERLIEVQLSQAFSESQASEHAMRMMAMKNATDNASDLIDDLSLAFNTARQTAITQELAEITGGAEVIR